MEKSTRQFIQVKYVLGSGDLIFTPLIVSSMDGEIKQGICYLFRRKRERPGTGYLRWTRTLECTLARYFHFINFCVNSEMSNCVKNWWKILQY